MFSTCKLQCHLAIDVPDIAIPQRCAVRPEVVQSLPPSATPLWSGQQYRHDRIRLAYLSADYHEHAIAYLVAGLFEHHDRNRFETIAVSFAPDSKSAIRTRLENSLERFIDVRNKSDLETATLLRDMEVDIAVDLTGLTGGSRPGILALRPAPARR